MSQASDACHTPVQQAGQKRDETFLVRIVSLDYYMAKPLAGLDICFSHSEGTAIDRVPVVQIYGSTPGGQKTCVHLHKAFPYFYVPYDNEFPTDPVQAQAFVRHFACALESAMHAGLESGAQRHQRVFAVQLVRATPYYGYYRDEALFMKIIMYNPTDVGRASKLLQGGGVVGKSLQPYEAHVPFLLQIKIDLNLAGMAWLHLSQINCRAPFPDRFMRRRRGWRDTPTLIQYEHDGPPGSGPSISEGSIAASQQDKLWVVDTLPTQWTLPVQTAAGLGRMLEKRSTCELEADACVEHVLNRGKLVRDKLEDVGPDKRMVESLAPMWDEERQRCGGIGPPDPPPDPLRDPKPLCATVDFVRAQFQAVADAHTAELGQSGSDKAATPASQPQPGDMRASQAERSSGASPASTSASQRVLLQQTQAANRVIPSQGLQSPSVPDVAYDDQNLFVAPGQNMPEMELQAEDIVRREDLDDAMEQDSAGKRPAVALQDGHEDVERHLRQLMELMHHEDSCSDEEGEGHARLMALAAQVATQCGPSQPVSQADVLHAHLDRATSQAEEECQAILGAAGATRPPSAAGAPDAEHASQAPRKQQRTDIPRTEQEAFTEQEHVLEDIQAFPGDISAHGGPSLHPQQGRNATWDGGGGPAAVAAASLRDQLGVFEGFSDDDDFHWSQIGSVRPQERPQSPGCSLLGHDRPMPQTDGAGDDSVSADSASRPDLPEMDEEDASEADSKVKSQQQTGRAEAGRQRVKSAGSQQTQSSSQRFGGLSLQKASPSSKSAPAPHATFEDTTSAQGGSNDARRSRSLASMAPAGRRKPPRTVRPLKLDSSSHTDGSRQSSGRLPGQYRPPMRGDAGLVRAPFRPPRPVSGTATPNGGSAQLNVAGPGHQQLGATSAPARGLGQYSMAVPTAGLDLPVSCQPLTDEDATPSYHVVHDTHSDSHQQGTDGEPAEDTGQHQPASQLDLDGSVDEREDSAHHSPAIGQLRAPRAHMRARRRPQLGGLAQYESLEPQPTLTAVPEEPMQGAEEPQHQHQTSPVDPLAYEQDGTPQETGADAAPLGESHASQLQQLGMSPDQPVGDQLDTADMSAVDRRRKSQEFVARVAMQSRELRSALADSTSSSDQRQEVTDQHAEVTAGNAPRQEPHASQLQQPGMDEAPINGDESASADMSLIETRQESQHFVAHVAMQSRELRAALADSTSSSEHRREMPDQGAEDMQIDDIGMDAASSHAQPDDEHDIVVDLSSPSPVKQETAGHLPLPHIRQETLPVIPIENSTPAEPGVLQVVQPEPTASLPPFDSRLGMSAAKPIESAPSAYGSQLGVSQRSQPEPAAQSPGPNGGAGMTLDTPIEGSAPAHGAEHCVWQDSRPKPTAQLPAPSDGPGMSPDVPIIASAHAHGLEQRTLQRSQPTTSAGRDAASPQIGRIGLQMDYRPESDASPVRLSLNLDLTASSKQTPSRGSAHAQYSEPASPAHVLGSAPGTARSTPASSNVAALPVKSASDEPAQASAVRPLVGFVEPAKQDHETPITAQQSMHDIEALQLSNLPLSALHPRGLFMSQPADAAAGAPMADIGASAQQHESQGQHDSAAATHNDNRDHEISARPVNAATSGGNSQGCVERHSDQPDPVQPSQQMHANDTSGSDSHHRGAQALASQPLGSPINMEGEAGDRGIQESPRQQPQRRSLDGKSVGPDSKLRAFIPSCRPPTREELQSSMAEQGILEILHQGVYYGNPADVPERPIVWAGLEFRVGSAATSSLPPFWCGSRSSGPSAMEAWKAAAQQQQQSGAVPDEVSRKLYAFTPAQPPPSRAETDGWLAQEKRLMEGSQASNSSRSKARTPGSAAHRPQIGVAFGMDANTGRLLPGQHGSSSQESGGSDLLETPALGTLPSQNRPGLGPSRLRVATQQSSGDELQEEEEIRPASPKYDERSFFYTTPKLNPARPALQRPVTPWATPNVAADPVPSEVVPCTLRVPAAAVPPSPDWAERSHVLSTPETPMAQMRPIVPPPLFDAANVPGTSAAHAGQQPSRGAYGAAAAKTLPVEDIQAKAKRLLGEPAKAKPWTSQITPPSPAVRGGATPVSQAGFRRLVPGKGQNLTLLSIELHADTRGTLLPDPRYDALRCIVLAAADDAEDMSDGNYTARVLLFHDNTTSLREGLPNVQMEAFESENALLDGFVEAVRALDPDILVGFEVQQGSLGFLVDRASTLERPDPLLRQLSRTPQVTSSAERRNDDYGQLHASGLHCHGRVVLNLWRLLRSELKLRIYTFESCVAAVLQLRTPHVPAWQLAQWFNNGPGGGRWRCIQYWVRRARLSLAMMEQLDMTGRTGELARAFGIDFFSVLTRGSQYRVEAMMVRLAHTQNYVLPAPSKQQTTGQPAMEAIPLVMEPESRLYVDPVIVLDFQSLYPSQIIAYNLCYSTCLGRPSHATAGNVPIRLGAQTFGQEKGIMRDSLSPEKLIVAPNGVAYAPPEARPGILPRLLQEILSTRIMVKAAMKRAPKSAKVLQRILNARQFGLKLIANVTYGYTAAGFSGRMPCAELADSIVQSGRETLENAIRMVEGNPKWRARVVYGDTDSLFVLLPGRSRDEAFEIGIEIAAAATAANPPPVTLKMEKVYHPCVLLAKKRYVGFMYESPKQTTPTFDAKGIETVRRDTCGAVAKMMERMLRILFTSKDLSQVENYVQRRWTKILAGLVSLANLVFAKEVKDYVQRQWTKILAGRVSLADFVFAKEVRLGTYSARHGIVPPAAIVAGKAMASDPRMEPRYGERVPYVVVYGEPGARLIDMVVSPHALIESQGRLRLHANYYITKQIIPALERIISLVGADMRAWFATMPRPQRLLPQKRPAAVLGLGGRSSAGTIDAYYLSRHCAVCDGLTHAQRPLCEACRAEPQGAASVLAARSMRLSQAHTLLVKVCLHCGGGGGRLQSRDGIMCDSLDCGVFFERKKAAGEAAAAEALCEAALALF